MRLTIKHTAIFVLVFSTLFVVSGFSARRPPKSLLADASGKGKIKVGKTEFPLYHVVVKLKEDGTAEITLASDIQVFFSGTWADNANKSIDLKISGSAQSSWQGTGKLFLRDDGKSIARLSLQGANKFRKETVQVSFVAD